MTTYKRGRVRRGAILVVALTIVLTGCQWSMARFDATGSGYNPFESTFDVGNVDELALELTASVAGASATVPVTSGSTAYVTAASSGLRAYDLLGNGCTGTPGVCQPLWSAASGTTVDQAIVAGTTVVVGVGPDLHAYDARGVTGCSGTPVVCQPLWTAPGWAGKTVADDGRIFVVTTSAVAAFDQAGAVGCTGVPKVCSPLWTYDVYEDTPLTSLSAPAVADGVLYVGTGFNDWFINGGDYGSIQAFDATGSVGCTGTPVVCLPRWLRIIGNVSTSPAVVDGTVYVASATRFENEEGGTDQTSRVEGFAADACWANQGCDATWGVKLSETYTGRTIAVANGLLHVSGPDATTWTYATGGGSPCAGAYPCEPLRRSAGTGLPAVTNDLLYVGRRAFDVSGTAGCSGSPITCQPRWTAAGTTGTAIPTNGRVLVWATTGGTSTLSVYRLPAA